MTTALKPCFVISPIGEDGSDIRRRADQVLKHIIRPAAEGCGYKAERADEIDKPGLITSQVITRVVQDELVIADMTGMNPNVFYELAIRHAIRLPLVQIIQKGERIPFDVAATRTIHVDHTDLDSAADARNEIMKQIRAIESTSEEIETPISMSLDLQNLRRSEDPEERNLAEVISELSDIRVALDKINESSGQSNNAEVLHILRQLRETVDQPYLFSPRRQKHFEREIFQSVSYLRHGRGADKTERAVAYALLGSFFKEAAPWVYESAMEVYRQVIHGTETKARNAEQAFQRVVMVTTESPIMRDVADNDKRLYSAHRLLRELARDLI